MQIDYNVLIAYGGVAKKFAKGDYIFIEDAIPNFYYQVIEGEVKVYSSNSNGKEIIQGIFTVGQSFGEPPLLLDKPYPSSAVAITPLVVIRLSKEKLNNILKDFPEIAHSFILTFAERMYNKASIALIRIGTTPEEIIEQFLHKYKQEHKPNHKQIHIPYTRQQIADFTSLRVETVIRTLKKMSDKKIVQIIDHKLYF